MRPLELAQKYMDIVFSTGEFDKLRHILANNLKFKGPLYSFDTAKDYINSMKADPPKKFKYRILKSYEDSSSACLVYNFSKPGVSTIMTQTFDMEDNKINYIHLIFDTGVFKSI
ncbi:MAG: hypothetical protein RIF33_01170 [Cyclobacteriaceae bacterium]